MATVKKASPKKAAAKKVVARPATKQAVVKREPTFTFEADEDGIVFKKKGKELACDFSFDSVDGMECSCGAIEANGISGLEEFLEDDRVPVGVIEAALKTYITEVKSSHSAAFMILSNNTQTPAINRILDRISNGKSTWERNPNSGSQIRVWIV